MYVNSIYSSDVPEFVREIAETDIMKRLRKVGMDCGCEYTSFACWQGLLPAKRYEHSIGVGLITWHFTHDVKQTVAALLHDVSSPVFAHVVDFMNHDYVTQESTESDTRKMIENSQQLQSLLKKYGLTTDEVCDYHMYPIADNDSPRLSADRLEYTMRNFYRYVHLSAEEIAEYYNDLTVIKNEEGEDELAFQTLEIAERFTLHTIETSRIYIQDADRYSMEVLGRILKKAMELNVLTGNDLYSGEKEVIEKLMGNEKTRKMWEWFCSISEMETSDEAEDDSWIMVPAKKRYINPLVRGRGRIMDISPEVRTVISEFLNISFDYYLKAK